MEFQLCTLYFLASQVRVTIYVTHFLLLRTRDAIRELIKITCLLIFTYPFSVTSHIEYDGVLIQGRETH